jgi:hypothetical protein
VRGWRPARERRLGSCWSPSIATIGLRRRAKLRIPCCDEAAERALHADLAHQSLGNVGVSLDPRAPVPDGRSGKLREVIAAVRA